MDEGLKVYKTGKRKLFDALLFLNLPVLGLFWLEKIRIEMLVLFLLLVNIFAVILWILLRSYSRVEIEKGKITGPGERFGRIAIALRKIDHKKTRRRGAGWGKRLWSLDGQAIILYRGLFTRGQIDRILDTLDKYPFREESPVQS